LADQSIIAAAAMKTATPRCRSRGNSRAGVPRRRRDEEDERI
jgi:hypothetical protein